MKRVRLAVIAFLALAVSWGAVMAMGHIKTQAERSIADRWREVVRAREDSIARLEKLLEVKEGERLSLMERLAGWERRETPAQAIVRVDTVVVEQVDTVLVAIEIDRSGSLERLATDSTRTALLLPQEDIGRCDLGLRIAGTRLDCREPRIGHFWLASRAGLSWPLSPGGTPAPEFGGSLTYKPAFRSPWSLRLDVNLVSGRASFMVERAGRISF